MPGHYINRLPQARLGADKVELGLQGRIRVDVRINTLMESHQVGSRLGEYLHHKTPAKYRACLVEVL